VNSPLLLHRTFCTTPFAPHLLLRCAPFAGAASLFFAPPLAVQKNAFGGGQSPLRCGTPPPGLGVRGAKPPKPPDPGGAKETLASLGKA